VGDAVNISVWRFTDLNRTVTLDPAGNIQFPFVGEMRASGLTLNQLRQELESRLAPYYVDPRVDISVNQVRSQVVHVLGEVRNPGSFALDKRMLAVEAIARAGGFTREANEEAVLLIRDGDPEPKVYRLSLNLRKLKTSPDRSVQISSNDVIFVPPMGVVDVARYMSLWVGFLDPFVSVGRSVLILDQVEKVLRGSSGSLLVSP
jgi:polysaccharide export outer membrane protein